MDRAALWLGVGSLLASWERLLRAPGSFLPLPLPLPLLLLLPPLLELVGIVWLRKQTYVWWWWNQAWAGEALLGSCCLTISTLSTLDRYMQCTSVLLQLMGNAAGCFDSAPAVDFYVHAAFSCPFWAVRLGDIARHMQLSYVLLEL